MSPKQKTLFDNLPAKQKLLIDDLGKVSLLDSLQESLVQHYSQTDFRDVLGIRGAVPEELLPGRKENDLLLTIVL